MRALLALGLDAAGAVRTMTGPAIGRGELRRDPAQVQVYRGTVTIAGFPYSLRATVEADDRGRYFALTAYAAPMPEAQQPE